nr:MAG TPA: Sigma 54 modulation/S30EA ribosomal protein C terminus [Caudoviricetes sp.]
MTREEAIAQLEDLRAHCEIFINEDSVWSDDVEALNIAIEVLKRERGAE